MIRTHQFNNLLEEDFSEFARIHEKLSVNSKFSAVYYCFFNDKERSHKVAEWAYAQGVEKII